MTFPILRREDSDYCPLLMCERCKEHTRHAKREKVHWAFVENESYESKSPKFRLVRGEGSGRKDETVTFRTAWECENCGHQRVWVE